MVECKNCPSCNVETNKDLCKHLKCTATKRGRTLMWSMCCVNQFCGPVNVYQRFADYLERHPRPKWCPRRESDDDGDLRVPMPEVDDEETLWDDDKEECDDDED